MEQNVVYPVLVGKIAERGIKKMAISDKLNITPRALTMKLNGQSPFTWPEVVTIHKTFFPDISMEDLMCRDRA